MQADIAWDYQVGRESRKNRLEELRAAITDAGKGSRRSTPEPERQPQGEGIAAAEHGEGSKQQPLGVGALATNAGSGHGRPTPEPEQEPFVAVTAPAKRGAAVPWQPWPFDGSVGGDGTAKNDDESQLLGAAQREVVQLRSALQASESSRKAAETELLQARRQAALSDADARAHAGEVAAVTEQLRNVQRRLDESLLELATAQHGLAEERQRSLARVAPLPDDSAPSSRRSSATQHHVPSDSRARRLIEEASILRQMARLTSPVREGVAKGRGAVAAAVAAGVVASPERAQHVPHACEDPPTSGAGAMPSFARNLLQSMDDTNEARR
eukprot:COSAG05_NODE_469_length_9505_cov_14.573676_6_plen_327_part_00